MPTIDREVLWSLLLGLACLGGFITLLLTASVIVVLSGTRWARSAFERWIRPDPTGLRTRLTQLQQRHPTLNNDALVEQIVAQQSLKAGLVGALTGLGGFAALPIAIPVDFALSTQLQVSLIHFIAGLYAPSQTPEQLQAQTYLILAGNRLTQQVLEASSRAAEAALTRLLTRLLAETVAESLLKVVPLVGAVVGFVFSYATARATGRLAARWYRGELRLPARTLPPADRLTG